MGGEVGGGGDGVIVGIFVGVFVEEGNEDARVVVDEVAEAEAAVRCFV